MMWLLTIEDEEGSSRYRRLQGERYTLGRGPRSDVVLLHSDVSRLHARLERDGEGWRVVDENSRNGVYVNGARVKGTHALGERDALQVGAYRLTLRKGFPPSVGTPPPFAMKPARLRVLWGPSVGTEYVIGRDDFVTMGASDACSLRLLHSNVSGEHAVVRTGRDGSHEIESRGGPIYVNGRPLSGGRRLRDGDTIDVGGVALVRYAAATPALDPHEESPRERASAEGSLEESRITLTGEEGRAVPPPLASSPPARPSASSPPARPSASSPPARPSASSPPAHPPTSSPPSRNVVAPPLPAGQAGPPAPAASASSRPPAAPNARDEASGDEPPASSWRQRWLEKLRRKVR
ncbi:MAG: FHA domain-containing protein, partial [Polyangiaceae bacterium]|nr:FHA domain-containing protein [Polyangiaceae bacterium]